MSTSTSQDQDSTLIKKLLSTIIVERTGAPIPSSAGLDWQALSKDYDEGDYIAHGSTEEEARGRFLDHLLDQEQEREYDQILMNLNSASQEVSERYTCMLAHKAVKMGKPFIWFQDSEGMGLSLVNENIFTSSKEAEEDFHNTHTELNCSVNEYDNFFLIDLREFLSEQEHNQK